MSIKALSSFSATLPSPNSQTLATFIRRCSAEGVRRKRGRGGRRGEGGGCLPTTLQASTFRKWEARPRGPALFRRFSPAHRLAFRKLQANDPPKCSSGSSRSVWGKRWFLLGPPESQGAEAWANQGPLVLQSLNRVILKKHLGETRPRKIRS